MQWIGVVQDHRERFQGVFYKFLSIYYDHFFLRIHVQVVELRAYNQVLTLRLVQIGLLLQNIFSFAVGKVHNYNELAEIFLDSLLLLEREFLPFS